MGLCSRTPSGPAASRRLHQQAGQKNAPDLRQNVKSSCNARAIHRRQCKHGPHFTSRRSLRRLLLREQNVARRVRHLHGHTLIGRRTWLAWSATSTSVGPSDHLCMCEATWPLRRDNAENQPGRIKRPVGRSICDYHCASDFTAVVSLPAWPNKMSPYDPTISVIQVRFRPYQLPGRRGTADLAAEHLNAAALISLNRHGRCDSDNRYGQQPEGKGSESFSHNRSSPLATC